MKTIISTSMVAFLALSGGAYAQMDHSSQMDHGTMNMEEIHNDMDHGSMNMGDIKAGEAMTMAKINSINTANRMINIDHAEVPGLGWPAMTMDMPVTKKVDLDSLEVGQQVMITIKKGRDNQFRITNIGH